MSTNKIIIVTLLVASLAVSALAGTPFLNQLELNRINGAQAAWKARIAGKFANMTTDQLKKYVSSFPPSHHVKAANVPDDETDDKRVLQSIPGSFDARNKWTSCVGPIRDQQVCGSCWAFATAEVFEDRLCIAGRVAPLVQRSTQYLVDCDGNESGCNGGNPNSAWDFLVTYGAPTEACYPYTGKQGNCQTNCTGGGTLFTRKARGVQTYNSAASAKNDLMTNGPIETMFEVYSDFFYYSTGIYTPTTNSFLGYHAVKVIGWGTDSGMGDYWIAANSWNNDWGENGFFRIKAGTCSFEDNFVAGTV
jgi:cathepsin B